MPSPIDVRTPLSSTYGGLVSELADPHRRHRAFLALLDAGSEALAAVRQGTRSPEASVRAACAMLLDHLMDRDSLPDLIRLLDDEAAAVRLNALHALSCDRCKEGDCRPAERDVLPRGIELLHADPHPRVRAMAAELVATYVHTSSEALAALRTAHASDAVPSVRKKAGLYLPGGPIHRRTARSIG